MPNPLPTPVPSRATAARARLLVLAVPKPQHLVVLLAGAADRDGAPLLREKLLDSLSYRRSSVVIDATDLTSCDLSALDTIVDVLRLAQRSGVHVTLQPSPHLAWLMGTVRQALPTSGQPDRDPSGCPLPRPSRQPSRQTA